MERFVLEIDVDGRDSAMAAVADVLRSVAHDVECYCDPDDPLTLADDIPHPDGETGRIGEWKFS